MSIIKCVPEIYLIKPSGKVNKLFPLLNTQLHHHRVKSIVQHDISQSQLAAHKIHCPRHEFIQILRRNSIQMSFIQLSLTFITYQKGWENVPQCLVQEGSILLQHEDILGNHANSNKQSLPH